ncbi:Iron-sulfur cluster assembly 1 like protein mitochondrial [Fasciola gigantica]|uniref:Iron-sulfur cluster assembly 1 homolog, mitochondrial n=1 Tax=Fasciola gigantica TaxID=46835 RepID=A0A504Z4V6_FASGI|nr:Iron-sulfur cluster assembly 1 like protein mitochondrial [Fasciola gigantica]
MQTTLLTALCKALRPSAVEFFSRAIRFRNLSNAVSNSVRTTAEPRRRKLVGRQPPLVLTDAAVNRIKELMAKNPQAAGLRVGVRTRGCNGLSYTLDFCIEGRQPGDEVVEQNGIRVFIDRRAQLTLLGTEMDYQIGLLASEFVFNNPNVKGTCGCGESFNV